MAGPDGQCTALTFASEDTTATMLFGELIDLSCEVSACIDTECIDQMRATGHSAEAFAQQHIEIEPDLRLSRIAVQDFITERPSLFLTSPRNQLNLKAIVLNVAKSGDGDDAFGQAIAVIQFGALHQCILIETISTLHFPEFGECSVGPLAKQFRIALSF
ncbi:hypothetical protein AS156_11175 [Bradyrhizobium macuxiense]|uniref:Uncharacterized protein n=1 Tax=Bradyrhizobium macuxiense TaxID=1755647 RepID=A0A109JN53_9BRAD|nr:hypothetical protein AS156_11175 [Bradyrhizobium macuxiense]